MKILCAVHRDPWCADAGGVERVVARLAQGLARRGHELLVVCGSLEAGSDGLERRRVEFDGGSAELCTIRRADLHHDHWQKSLSARAGRRFEDLVAAERPQVVHVHHWLRLSRDLVLRAARAGAPAAVTLHDHHLSCPLTFRVRPDGNAPCESKSGVVPCVACADSLPPKAHWLPTEARWTEFSLRRHDLVREARLARVLLAPSPEHAAQLRRHLAPELDPLAFEVLPHPSPALPRLPPADTSDGVLRVAVCGRLAREKGVDVLFDAYDAAAARAAIELHLLGAAGDAASAERYARRAAVHGARVVLHGAYEAGRLASHPALARCHLAVLPSIAAESHGLVLDELLQLGRPCLVSALPAYAARAQAGCLAFAPGDAQQLARLLVELAQDPRRVARLAAELPPARDPLAEEEAWLARHEALYGRCLEAGAPPTPAGGEAWYEERMRTFAETQWDAALSRSTRAQLGYDA